MVTDDDNIVASPGLCVKLLNQTVVHPKTNIALCVNYILIIKKQH